MPKSFEGSEAAEPNKSANELDDGLSSVIDNDAVNSTSRLEEAIARGRTKLSEEVQSANEAANAKIDTSKLENETLNLGSEAENITNYVPGQYSVSETQAQTKAYPQEVEAPPAPTVPVHQAAPTYDPQQGYFVQAPLAPLPRSNRGLGAGVAVIGTIVFAAIFLVAGYGLHLLAHNRGDELDILDFSLQATVWVPVVVFFLGYLLLISLINRGPGWVHAVTGLFIAALVYISGIAAQVIPMIWDHTPTEFWAEVSKLWWSPLAIIAGVIAREIPIWFGGWLGSRGRKLAERNREDRAAYEDELASLSQPY